MENLKEMCYKNEAWGSNSLGYKNILNRAAFLNKVYDSYSSNALLNYT